MILISESIEGHSKASCQFILPSLDLLYLVESFMQQSLRSRDGRTIWDGYMARLGFVKSVEISLTHAGLAIQAVIDIENHGIADALARGSRLSLRAHRFGFRVVWQLVATPANPQEMQLDESQVTSVRIAPKSLEEFHDLVMQVAAEAFARPEPIVTSWRDPNMAMADRLARRTEEWVATLRPVLLEGEEIPEIPLPENPTRLTSAVSLWAYRVFRRKEAIFDPSDLTYRRLAETYVTDDSLDATAYDLALKIIYMTGAIA